MVELFIRGGLAMWLILAAGVAAMSIFLERLFNLHRAQIRADDFLKGIYNILARNNLVEAVSICEETPGPVAQIVRTAILHIDESPEHVRQAIEETGLSEIPLLEHNLSMLATVAQITPLIGLFGTVLGMIQVLWTIQQKAPLVHSGDLMGGLWRALIATAASLLVSIPAYAAYNFLVARVASIVLDMDRAANSVLTFLNNRPNLPRP